MRSPETDGRLPQLKIRPNLLLEGKIIEEHLHEVGNALALDLFQGL